MQDGYFYRYDIRVAEVDSNDPMTEVKRQLGHILYMYVTLILSFSKEGFLVFNIKNTLQNNYTF